MFLVVSSELFQYNTNMSYAAIRLNDTFINKCEKVLLDFG